MDLKDFYEDKKFVQSRIPFILVAAVLVFLLLLIGLWNLQLLKSKYYIELAEKNRIRSIPWIAPRGRILDRNGQIVVDNQPSFTLIAMRENLPLIENSLDLLASGLNLDKKFLESQFEKYRHLPSYLPIPIKEDITIKDLSFIKAHRLELPGLEEISLP